MRRLLRLILKLFRRKETIERQNLDKMGSYRILIVGDSRTRHLQDILDQTSLNLSFHVITLPGAKLNDLALKTIAELSYHDLNYYSLVILVGGINNLTKLVYRPTRHAIPRHKACCNLINFTLNEMGKAIERIKFYFATPVALASLTGIDLVNYSPQYYGKLFHMQPLIDEAITVLNKRIRGLNRTNGLKTPDLSSDIHRCSGKGGRYRTHYIHLYDGLHPGHHLRTKWAKKIFSYCAEMFTDLSHCQERIDGDRDSSWIQYNTYYY